MIVIADDITGAAEIAGIAHSYGLRVLVIATDTRSMSEAEAIAETRRIAAHLPPPTTHPSPLTSHPFKKTDSALRGHVVAELSALMEATGCQRCVFLPANPSKGRIIRKGIYYINGIPIADTDFSFDPEFPAKTSVLKERFPDAERHHIIMPDAESEEDIKRIVAAYDDGNTLFAGAADLFKSLIHAPIAQAGGADPCPPDSEDALKEKAVLKLLPGEPGVRTLILCGSTQSKPQGLGIPVCAMPLAVYEGREGADAWFESLRDSSPFASRSSLILTIPHRHLTGKDVAIRLRSVMAEMARRLVEYAPFAHLVVEGGATAWATLQSLGWTSFEVVRQIAPGVVQLRSDSGVLVTLKPGSYPWGQNSQLLTPNS